MTAGLPGAGIGGIFYLASALLMPVRELGGFVRDPRAPRRWGVALRQASLAAGILGALWGTGWLLALVLPETVRAPEAVAGAAGTVSRNVVKLSALAFSLGTLALVLALVQVARVLVRRRPAPTATPLRVPTPLAVRAVRDPITDRRRHPTRWRPAGESSGQFPRFAS